MIRHTPGPWKRGGMQQGPNRVYAGKSETVCTVEGISNGGRWPKGESDRLRAIHEQGKANARLIAAAPDLLAALKSAVNHIAEMGCTCMDRSEGHQRDCTGAGVASDLEKVITKAEGKS